MKLLYDLDYFYQMAPSVNHYPGLLVSIFDAPEVEIIKEPSDDHYIVHVSYYKITSYLYNKSRKNFQPKNIGSYAVGFFEDRISEDLKNNRATLLITNDVDTIKIRDVLNLLPILLDFGIPKQSLIYVDSNPWLEKTLLRHGYQGFYYSWVDELFNVDYIKESSDKIDALTLRDKKFLFFGGKPRPHRVEFLKKCFESIPNFEQDSFVSIGMNPVVGKKTLDVVDNWVSKAYKRQEEYCTPWDQVYSKISYEHHINSYWNISPSTQYYYEPDRLSINEKQYKSIVALQPFILLAEPRMLKFLKDAGYKTFDKWIDESYDNTLCDATRMNKIVEEVKKLNNLSHSDLSTMLKDMLPILIHNAELYMTIANQKKVKTDLISNLRRFVKNESKM